MGAQNPNNWDTAWVSSFGGINIDFGKDLKETKDKGLIICGTTGSFGQGKSSFYLIKTDSLGHYQWSKALGSSENDLAASVELTDDGGYFITGSSNLNLNKGYDGYLIKTDANGNVVWSKTYGGNDWDFFYQSCKTPDGGLVFCGESYSGINGDTQAFLLRVNAQGDELWRREYGGSGNDVFNAVKYHSGSVYAAGKSWDANTNTYKAIVFKLDINGNTKLQNYFGGSNNENMTYIDLFISSKGNLWLGGRRGLDTSNHCILRKMDTLNFNEMYYMTNGLNLHFASIVEGRNSEVYAMGTTLGNIGGKGVICLRYDSVFTQLGYDFYDGKNDEEATRMIRTSKGYAFVGYTTTFGNTSTKEKNVFLTVLNKPNMSNNHFQLISEYSDLLSPVSINEHVSDQTEFSLFPNPVINRLIIQTTESATETVIVIKNISGQLVLAKQFEETTGTKFEVNVQFLNEGIYFLEVFQNQQLLGVKKLVK